MTMGSRGGEHEMDLTVVHDMRSLGGEYYRRYCRATTMVRNASTVHCLLVPPAISCNFILRGRNFRRAAFSLLTFQWASPRIVSHRNCYSSHPIQITVV